MGGDRREKREIGAEPGRRASRVWKLAIFYPHIQQFSWKRAERDIHVQMEDKIVFKVDK